MQNGFDALLARRSATAERCNATSAVVEACRKWVERLGDNVTLETAAREGGRPRSQDGPPPHREGRGRGRGDPPSAGLDPDIRPRVEAYVAGLVDTVKITGFQAGEHLVIKTLDSCGWDKPLDALQVEALMRPDKVVDALLALIGRRSEAPCPAAERPARIAALEREVLELRYVEEALVTAAIAEGQAVVRDTDAPPAAVLGVRVVVAKPATTPAEKQQKVRDVA
jgi:hypothetical protein